MIRVGHLDTGVDWPVAASCSIGNRGEFSDEPGRDTAGHGTQTAALICQSCEQVSLSSAAVIDGGDVLVRILVGLDWVRTKQVRVVSASLGSPGWNPILQPMFEVLRTEGVFCVAAIGNESTGTAHFPGNYPCVFSVGATYDDGRVWRWSGSHHPDNATECVKPDVVAPGVKLKTVGRNGKETLATGTSMASAHVAGVAASLLSEFPDRDAEDLWEALTMTALPLHDHDTHRCRTGLLDVERARNWMADNRAERVSLKPTEEEFHDPRLKWKLSRDNGGDPGVIFVARLNAAAGLSGILSDALAKTDGVLTRSRCFDYARTGFAYGSVALVNAIVQHSDVQMVSAVDVMTVFERAFS